MMLTTRTPPAASAALPLQDGVSQFHQRLLSTHCVPGTLTLDITPSKIQGDDVATTDIRSLV